MISPQGYVSEQKGKSYDELIRERVRLLEMICRFEQLGDKSEIFQMSPSPEVIYQCNLQYLAELSSYMTDRYNLEFVRKSFIEIDTAWLFTIQEFLEEKGLRYNSAIDDRIEARQNGKQYSFSEHLQGLIYALLSNQRPWIGVEPHLAEIDEVFYDYDAEKVKATPGSHFAKLLCAMKCGNRNIGAQMDNLAKNIFKMENIEKEYGSMDAFVTSAPAPKIVRKLSDYNSKYKLYNVGASLAWEYIRNVGIDGAKPDVHLCRFFGGDRMGDGNHTPATTQEVYDTILSLSQESELSMGAIDTLVWSYCADGYGEICTAHPRCAECEIYHYCKK